MIQLKNKNPSDFLMIFPGIVIFFLLINLNFPNQPSRSPSSSDCEVQTSLLIGLHLLLPNATETSERIVVMQHENCSLQALISPGVSLLLLVFYKKITCKTTET